MKKLFIQHIALAHELEDMMKQDSRFEVTHEVKMGLVCFKLRVSKNCSRSTEVCCTPAVNILNVCSYIVQELH